MTDQQVAVPTSTGTLRIAYKWKSDGKWQSALLDVLAVFALPILTLALFGASQWVPPYSPDSQFYFGLSNFASDLTQHLTDPAYYWTRIGLIGPLHALINAVGYESAYLVWRCALLVLTVLPVYLLTKSSMGRLAASISVVIVATNTTVLVTLADVYPSSAAIAGMSLLAGFGCIAIVSETSRARWIAAAVAGGAAGWLPAIHIGTVAVCVASSCCILLMLGVRFRLKAWTPVLAFGVASLASFCIFLLWARLLFPGLDWWSANFDRVTQTNWDGYHEPDLNWLWTDPNLLVVPLALAVGLIALTRKSSVRPVLVVSCALLAAVSAIALVQQFVFDGQNLQLPYYYSQLWPFALMVIALGAVSVCTDRWQTLGVLIACVVLLPLAGFSQFHFGWIPAGILIALIALLAFSVSVLITDMGIKIAGRIGVAAGVVVLLVSLQLLQNGLNSAVKLIISRQTPAAAFADYPDWGDYYEFTAQSLGWALEKSPPDERLVFWGGGTMAILAGTYASADASMMRGFGLSPNVAQLEFLKMNRPSYIVFTSDSQEYVHQFIRAIPVDSGQPTILECHDFKVGQYAAASCIAKFRWKRSAPTEK